MNNNKKKLSLDLNKVNKYVKPNYEYQDIQTIDPYEIPGNNIKNLPKIPSYCTKVINKRCTKCPYYLNNQATLIEFGKLVDMEDFQVRAFVGVLGTDTRVRCENITSLETKLQKNENKNKNKH